jgi:hypothetical protein
MADIKDIFGESDSEDDNDQQQAPVDVGKLFELSEDEEEAPIQRKRPAGRLQKNAAAAPPKKKDEGGAYDDEDDGVRDCVEIEFRCASHIRLHPTHWLISTQVMDDADRAFIDNTDETEENKAILAEYAKEKQNFAGDRPGAADDFEQDEKKKPSRADDENNPMKPTLDRMKRKKRKELGADDKDKIVQSLLQRMGDALNEDKEALNRGEPATAKVKLLPLVGRLFKQRALRQTLLEYDALDLVREWLTPNKGVQPMLAIRTALLEAMSELPAQPEHLKRSGIGRIVMKMANNKQETRDNRTMARNLVEAWARPVVGKVGDMKSLEAMTARRAPVDSQAARVDHNQDDAGEIFEREGEESKNRARVRVPQFNGFAFTVRPASTADPARSKGKRAPKADSAQGRLHKRTKKR